MNVSMQARLVGSDRYLFVNTQRANLRDPLIISPKRNHV
ncbi:Uncharacterised protein [Salmonella enterica subsp. enterica serovar Typhi]|nr:Uncharacterised protein [Salmonella enterica subsp. enterica serovar Typhi]CHE85932.1 Uncharacterised protein [Salmonella enterica subsp. enterica serovar Typhi]